MVVLLVELLNDNEVTTHLLIPDVAKLITTPARSKPGITSPSTVKEVADM